MGKAAIKVIGGLVAAFFAASALAEAEWYYLTNPSSFSTGWHIQALGERPLSACLGLTAANWEQLPEACAAVAPGGVTITATGGEYTVHSAYVGSSHSAGITIRWDYDRVYGDPPNHQSGILSSSISIRRASCPADEKPDENGICQPETPACVVGERLNDYSWQGYGLHTIHHLGCEYAVEDQFCVESVNYCSGNLVGTGRPSAPGDGGGDSEPEPHPPNDEGAQCITGESGKEVCGKPGGGGSFDGKPYDPWSPAPNDCRFYSLTNSWICRGNPTNPPVNPQTGQPAQPQEEWQQAPPGGGSLIDYSGGQGVKPGSGGTDVDYGGGDCEGDDCPPEGTCDGDDCPSVSDFGAEELEMMKDHREGLQQAVEGVVRDAPLEPGFNWWNTGSGSCVGIQVNLGKFGGGLMLDAHCQAYDNWVRPALEFLLYAFTVMHIWGIWHQTIREVN